MDNIATGSEKLAFAGYRRRIDAEPDLALCEVGRSTPGGEYHRRFWQPVRYTSELGEVPLRVRALAEDLIAFRDLSGRFAVMHLHCCHRNTSLEYGILTEQGIKCCYHGRVFDIDGTMPFEERHWLEMFGQTDERPYRDRQWIPGDHDTQVSQGPINPHALEHLGTQDRGLILFRQMVRRDIDTVRNGGDPKGYFPPGTAVAPSFANDRIVPVAEIGGDADDPAVLVAYAELLAGEYLTTPPMGFLT